MYYLILGFFYLISWLPFPLLYLLSDFIHMLIYRLFGYRKKIVLDNIAVAFPEKTEAERREIASRFYRAFVDNWLEAIKLLSMRTSTLQKRFKMDFGPLPRLLSEGKSCQIHLGHHFNWEWANIAFGSLSGFTLLGVYQPISNKAIDRLFRYFRKRSGTVLLAANNMQKEMIPFRDKQYILGLVADQNPPRPQKAFWANFFSKPAPFVIGPEKNARRQNIPVLFARITKLKRGYYSCTLVMAEEFPAQTSEGYLTKKFIDFLEEVIQAQPENWLWSHRRWKHSWREEYANKWLAR